MSENPFLPHIQIHIPHDPIYRLCNKPLNPVTTPSRTTETQMFILLKNKRAFNQNGKKPNIRCESPAPFHTFFLFLEKPSKFDPFEKKIFS